MIYTVYVREQKIAKKLSIKSKNIPVLTYKVRFPHFSSTAFTQTLGRMNAYYQTGAQDYIQYLHTTLLQQAVQEYAYSTQNGYPFRAYESVQAFTVTYNQDCVISLYLDRYEFTGGAHGNTVRTSDNWELTTGQRLTLSDLFPGSPQYRVELLVFIFEQIRERIESGSDQFFDEYEKLAAEAFNEESFYLTPEGLAIYFQQYDIAPYSSGIPTFIIPYDKINILMPRCIR